MQNKEDMLYKKKDNIKKYLATNKKILKEYEKKYIYRNLAHYSP